MAASRTPEPTAEDALYLRIITRLAAAGVAVGDAASRGAVVVAQAAYDGAGYVTESVETALGGAKDASLFFRVPSGLRNNLKRLAAERERRMEELLTEALVDLLIKHGKLLPGPKDPAA